jgi:hypothetical protein
MTHQIVGWMLAGIIPLVLIWVVVNWIHAGQTMDSITRERDFCDYGCEAMDHGIEVVRPWPNPFAEDQKGTSEDA